jgi:hypothetical protein
MTVKKEGEMAMGTLSNSTDFKTYVKESYKTLGNIFKGVKPALFSDDDLDLPRDFTALTLKQIGRYLSIHRNHATHIKNELAKIVCYLELYNDRAEVLEARLFKDFVAENKKASITEAKKTMRLDPEYNAHLEYVSELSATKRFMEQRIEVHEDIVQSLSRELTRRNLEEREDG